MSTPMTTNIDPTGGERAAGGGERDEGATTAPAVRRLDVGPHCERARDVGMDGLADETLEQAIVSIVQDGLRARGAIVSRASRATGTSERVVLCVLERLVVTGRLRRRGGRIYELSGHD